MLNWLRNRRGSAMVEFALVLPLLAVILVGIMVIGVVINAKLVVAGAAREAGRTWAIVKQDGTARDRAVDAIRGGGLRVDNPTLFDPRRDVLFNTQGNYVYATVTYRQPTFAPLIADLLDPANASRGYLTLRSQAVFRMER